MRPLLPPPSGPRHWLGREKTLERVLMASGVVYVLLLLDVVYGGAGFVLDRFVLDVVVVVPDALRAVVGFLLSAPGSTWILAPLVLVLSVYMWRKGSLLAGVLVAASPAALALFLVVTKWVVGRPRPSTFIAGESWMPEWFIATSGAFPSGHSAAPVLIFGLALVVLAGPRPDRTTLLPVPSRFPPPLLWGALALAFLPGVGRVVWGLHWASDVAAGWLLGLAWLAGTLLAAMLWQQARSDKKPEAAEGGEVEPTRSGLGGLYDP